MQILDKKYNYNGEILTEVRAGQTGRGLLIENDGHILTNTDTIKQIREDISHGDKFIVPDDFIVSAVFQKYGIQNKNGRIYPEAVLKREVDNYIKEAIASHCAVGAVDHPSCTPAGTLILTEKGWVDIKDVQVGDNILTVTEDKKIEVHPVRKKIDEPYKGKLIHLKSRFIDVRVTPNHRFPVLDRFHNFKGFYTAQDILDHNIPDQGHSSLFKYGEWEGANDENFVIDAIPEEELVNFPAKHKKYAERYREPLVIPMEVWMKFMGIYLSEGNVLYTSTGKPSGASIAQLKKEVIDEIVGMLEEFPLEYKLHGKNKRKAVHFHITDWRLGRYLQQFGKCYDKFVPYEIKKQSKEMLRVFYDWFVMGDGRQRGRGAGRYTTDDVFSTSKRLAMDLNEIQLKIGYNGTYHEEDRHIDRLIEGRLIKAENSQNMFFSFRSLLKHIVLNDKSLTVTEEDYDGRVYCVEVENHTFYAMGEDGHCFWSGNSLSLSGHDVSHNIIELHWEGATLVGKMKLHVSPGFKRYGICSTSGDLAANMIIDGIRIGVSSRGAGNVVEKNGIYYVDDSFSLVGWDIVLEPSTPGSYIDENPENLRQFIDMRPNVEDSNMDNKLDLISKILQSYKS